MFMTIQPIRAERLRQIRAERRDDNGERPAYRVHDEGGVALRCCLRESRQGERIALIGYRPFRLGGPYAEVGPIFVHAAECAGYSAVNRYPEEFRGRPQVFRAYRADGTIAGGSLVEPGYGQEQAVAELLVDPDVAFLHSRNVVFGCFMFEITRPGPVDPGHAPRSATDARGRR